MGHIRLRFIVEGVHDEHVIGHLLHRHKVDTKGFDFYPKEDRNRNKNYVLKNLRDLLEPAEDESVDKFALILDAEEGVMSRWQEIRRAIGSELPEAPDSDGTMVGTKLGIWLMPDNTAAGSVEEFFETLIPGDDNLWRHAQESVPKVPEGDGRFLPAQTRKALVNSWLAWRNPPGLPMGKTIARSNLRHDSELALRFVNWVKALLAE